ncbi:MAG: cell envelope integrity protein TolA [Sandaracinaceae bacterium]|nr:cell envelope integrity protein TolA [Sandaracinaceae bacterium]
MPRALIPSAFVLGAALLVSIGLHVNVYEGLAVLGTLIDRARPVPAPAEIDFVVIDPGAVTPPDEEAPPTPSVVTDPSATPPTPAPEERDRARPQIAPPRERPRPLAPPPEPPPPAPPPEVALPVPAAPTPPPPAPPPPDDRRSIVQRSDDPSVDNPDARFLADQARIVEQETIASLRNTLRDDPDPVASATEQADPEAEVEGNDREDESADLREVEGDDRRRVTEHEAEQDPARDTVASTSRRPSDQGSATSTSGGTQSQAGTPSRGQEGGAQARGGGAPPGHDVLVTDRFGSYVVRVPDAQSGAAPGAGGGAHVEGPGQGASGLGRLAGRSGERGGGAEARSGTRGGQQLGLSYSEFESVFGEDELRREREARLEERRSRSRGHARAAEWNAFRAAIENYTPEVRPGNQTALNAAASPFATFLSDMHRRIHREFADRYIASLGPDAAEGQNDPTLRTTLEISVNEDGSLNRVGIVSTSGNTLFDFAAFSSVWRAQPFPRPPGVILSGDGRAWLRWHFDRGPRHCGTWNAEPYMLANGTGPVDRGEPPEDELPTPSSSGDGFQLGPALPAEGRPG